MQFVVVTSLEWDIQSQWRSIKYQSNITDFFILSVLNSIFPYKLVLLHIHVICFLFIPLVVGCGFLSSNLLPVRNDKWNFSFDQVIDKKPVLRNILCIPSTVSGNFVTWLLHLLTIARNQTLDKNPGTGRKTCSERVSNPKGILFFFC